MANVLVEELSLQNIADAIRNKKGEWGTPTEKLVGTDVSHTPNATSMSTKDGGYGDKQDLTDTVTIPGADRLIVTMAVQTESTTYDYVYVAAGTTPPTSGTKYGGSSLTTEVLEFDGDSVSFHFISDTSNSNYLGYWANVQGFANVYPPTATYKPAEMAAGIESIVTPEGTISIATNGTYDVAAYENAVVSVAGGGGGDWDSTALAFAFGKYCRAPGMATKKISKSYGALSPTTWNNTFPCEYGSSTVEARRLRVVTIPGASSIKVNLSYNFYNHNTVDDSQMYARSSGNVKILSGEITDASAFDSATVYGHYSDGTIQTAELTFDGTDTVTFYYTMTFNDFICLGYYAEVSGYDASGNIIEFYDEGENTQWLCNSPADVETMIYKLGGGADNPFSEWFNQTVRYTTSGHYAWKVFDELNGATQLKFKTGGFYASSGLNSSTMTIHFNKRPQAQNSASSSYKTNARNIPPCTAVAYDVAVSGLTTISSQTITLTDKDNCQEVVVDIPTGAEIVTIECYIKCSSTAYDANVIFRDIELI